MNPEMQSTLKILQSRPVAYHPILATVCGGAMPALFLSQLLYWDGKGAKSNWIWKTQKEMEQETGLTIYEQNTAREKLKGLGLLHEKLAGIPATLHYRVDSEKLIELLQAVETSDGENQILEKPETSFVENPKQDSGKTRNLIEEKPETSFVENQKQDSGKPRNLIEEKPETISETTTETTTQNTSETTSETTTDTTTDTTREEGPAASPQNVYTIYEEAIGPLTAFIASEIEDLCKECEEHRHTLSPGVPGSDLDGEAWVSQAIITAANSTARPNPRYVKAIITRWLAEGYKCLPEWQRKQAGNDSQQPRRIRIGMTAAEDRVLNE